MSQRYSPACLRSFINGVIGDMMTSSPVYIKTRWTTSASSELYPFLVETPLLFGKDRPGIFSKRNKPSDWSTNQMVDIWKLLKVTDKHRKIVMEQFLQQTLQSILLDGNINVAGIFVDYIDSWATPYATHYTNGLVETNLLRRGFKVRRNSSNHELFRLTEIQYDQHQLGNPFKPRRNAN